MSGLSETPSLFYWSNWSKTDLYSAKARPTWVSVPERTPERSSRFPRTLFLNIGHVSKYVTDFCLQKEMHKLYWGAGCWVDYERQFYGCFFFLVFTVWECLCLGTKREWGWIFKLIFVLLWRDPLVIPVATKGKLRRLRAESKTADILWKGMMPYWNCSLHRKVYASVLFC